MLYSTSVTLCHFLRRVTWCLYVSFDLSIGSMIKCTVYQEVFFEALHHAAASILSKDKNYVEGSVATGRMPSRHFEKIMCQQLTTCRPCCRPSWQRPGDTSSLMLATVYSSQEPGN